MVNPLSSREAIQDDDPMATHTPARTATGPPVIQYLKLPLHLSRAMTTRNPLSLASHASANQSTLTYVKSRAPFNMSVTPVTDPVESLSTPQ